MTFSFREWRDNRRARKRAQIVLNYILDQLERGVPVEDLFAYTVDTHVRWSQPNGVWFILIDERMKPGELVHLKHGRGDREESARIVELLDSECIGNVFAYSIRFDVETVES